MTGLQNKVVILTGASGGIGQATAVAFARVKARLCLTGRDEAKLLQTKNKCLQAGLTDNDIIIVTADLVEEQEMMSIVTKTVEKFGHIDVLVNNAGYAVTGTFLSTNVGVMDDMYNIHVRAVFNLTKAAAPHLIESKGAIVNVSSIAGTRPVAYCFAYSMAKSALNLMTEMLATELGPKGVRVNSVNPGVIKTDIFVKPGAHMSHAPDKLDQFYESMASAHPLQKVGEPEEVADVIVFLSSKSAGFISGAIVPVDGARSCTVSGPTIKMSD